MNKPFDQWIYTAGGFALAATLFGVPRLFAAEDVRPVQVKPVFSEQLPNVPGKTLTGVLVKYAPGGKSPSHAHAGSVYAYVLSGQIRSENSVTGPVRVYSAGEGFFEPPGSTHTISENASDSEPATLLAIFVADDGAQLTRGAAEAK
jgi:quercetin dioxygenase-like cupin family protein